MKSKLLFLFVLICVNPWLHSITYHIKQDGTGNFTTIQAGIEASTNTDTVLVYPGTYYENIDYLEKSLTVASLYIITPEDSLINQTIINGNQISRCVKIDECENISLIGFTLQNGKVIGGSYTGWGGGILIMDTLNGLVSNCKIINNTALYGGGLGIGSSNILLKSNTIAYNHGIYQGGGLDLEGLNNVVFDPVDLNSIYLNYSCTGSDIKLYSPGEYYEIIVDTFTVAEPDYFFIAPFAEYSFLSQNHKIEQIDQDLYVAPDGDDDNSGLTFEEPLQTISWAQTLIRRNDENPHTIHLAPGIYSPSLNNQVFPIGIKHGTKYIGISTEETVLDAENQTSIIRFGHYPEDELPKLYLENIKLINASSIGDNYSAIKTLKTDLELNNVIIENSYGDVGSAILCRDGIYNFKNVEVINNLGGKAIRISCLTYSTNPILQINMENILISNNYPGQGTGAGSGGGANIRGHHEIVGDYSLSMLNCDFNSNHNNFYDGSTGLGGSSGLFLSNYVVADIVNCTFADNTLSYNTGCVITAMGADINIYNSILYDNDGYSFIIWNDENVNISHSLIENGDSNVYYYSNGAIIWLEGNLDENPLWLMSGEFPYMLSETSPCIDAGTLDLPAGIELPEFDLAGNPRIYGVSIDMGAYEFQDSVSVLEDIITPITQTIISNYPNPFNPTTTIKLDLAESGEIDLAIYNIKGQKVKTLMDAYSTKGHFEIIWRGIDDNKRSVASGNYFIKLKVNGEEKAVSKCVLLK
ncbi:MAG: T9SS type A sorting domain-containing protein [Saprospiraceae bacterium]|nr:T9SS type A sorting domain-containing protein [Saprospiraceae bacterium]